MEILNTKTFAELVDESTNQLKAIGMSTTPGGIARLFLNIINKQMEDIYKCLTVNHLRAFVTTATGDALDAIGVLVNCSRLLEESDDNYRYRITVQCLMLATSNETAVKLELLTLDGVEDVKLQPYSMGTGSFSAVIITLSDTPEEVLQRAQAALQNVHGYGIRYDVRIPTVNRVKLSYKIYIEDTVSDVDKQDIRYKAQEDLILYLSSLNVGEDIYIDKLNQVIMNASPKILSIQNTRYLINNQKALYVNQECRWFERYYVSTEADNVIIT